MGHFCIYQFLFESQPLLLLHLRNLVVPVRRVQFPLQLEVDSARGSNKCEHWSSRSREFSTVKEKIEIEFVFGGDSYNNIDNDNILLLDRCSGARNRFALNGWLANRC